MVREPLLLKILGAVRRRLGFAAESSPSALLRLSEERYRTLFESNPHPMWVYDVETLRFLAVNDSAIHHYGYGRDEFLAMTIADIRPPEARPALLESVRTAPDGVARSGIWCHRKKDGALVDVEITSHPIPFGARQARLVLATDITDRKRVEDQLRQSQKMEAIGRLAGGVAHDFNNLLGVILGYSDLLEKEIGPAHRAYPRVEQIRKAAERAATLTRQLLTFSRKQILQPDVLDLNAVLADVETMLRRLIGEDVQLETVFGADLGRVLADPGQMQQVVLNLAVNARDAMPGGGKLVIETGNLTIAPPSLPHIWGQGSASESTLPLGERHGLTSAGLVPGPYVTLTVADTGHGMDEDTRSRIFEPFFTTKAPHKGTGLGLATVYGIVRQGGGHVQVDSEPGRGATFRIYLPRVSGDAAVTAETTEAPEGPPRHESILVVEDEAALRFLICEILARASYTVLEAAHPEQALAIARSPEAKLDLVLTDVIMPGMSGPELWERVRALRPDARVVYMSGYTDDSLGHHGVLDAQVHLLQKPFSSEGLLEKLRAALDGPRLS